MEIRVFSGEDRLDKKRKEIVPVRLVTLYLSKWCRNVAFVKLKLGSMYQDYFPFEVIC